MKILITGGAGFIGSNLILHWLRHHPEDHLVNLDALTYAGNLSNLQTICHQSNYDFVRADLKNREQLSKIFFPIPN